MADVGVIKLRVLISILSRLGFQLVSQRGSHMKFKGTKDGILRVVIVPRHDEVRRGTLFSILRQAGVSKEEFARLLEEKPQ